MEDYALPCCIVPGDHLWVGTRSVGHLYVKIARKDKILNSVVLNKETAIVLRDLLTDEYPEPTGATNLEQAEARARVLMKKNNRLIERVRELEKQLSLIEVVEPVKLTALEEESAW